MTDSIPPVQFPIVDMVTGSEANITMMRATLAKQVPDVDAFLSAYDVRWRVAMRPVEQSDGTTLMMWGVVIWSATPKPPPAKEEA